MLSLFCNNNAPVNDGKDLEAKIVTALRSVHDPEIPVNIYDLGLIYEIETDEHGSVSILMTLTAPACPVAGIIPQQVEAAVLEVNGVSSVSVDLVWDPPWNQDRMSDEAKLTLGLM